MTTLQRVSAVKEALAYDKEACANKIGREKCVAMYRDMIRVREFDNKIAEIMVKGIVIVQHSTRGEEGSQIGALSCLEDHDYVMPYHRGWGWTLGKGMDAGRVLAELMCRNNGYSFGRAGSQLGDYKLRVMGRPGIQGAHVPIASGVGLSIKLRKTNDVVLCMNGNGASNTGNFYEAINMAGIWKAPVVFLVANNLYEIYERYEATTAVEDVALRALAANMPGYIVDGNDPIMVHTVVSEAVDNARKGLGPALVESKTYRHEGHMSGDTHAQDGTYRPIDEMNAWFERDPVPALGQDLLDFGMAGQADLERIHEDALAEMDEAEKYAMSGRLCTKEELLRWNYM